MITPPTTGTFQGLTVDIVAGPAEEVDYVHASLPLPYEMTNLLTEDDVDAMANIIVERMKLAHPDYDIHIYRTWKGTNATGPDVVYQAPPSEE